MTAQSSTAHSSWHFERFTSATEGRQIIVRCFCALNRDHTYSDWIENGLNPWDQSTPAHTEPTAAAEA